VTASKTPRDQGAGSPLGFGDRPGSIRKGDVAERMRKVTEQLAGLRIHLFGQQPKIVREGRGRLKYCACSIDLIGQREACASQNVQSKMVPSSPARPSTASSVRYR
jgi:hypothetical protein